MIKKGENMSERVTADDVRHVETKIIMTEDKMFREKNYYKKLEIREEIIFLRKKLQAAVLKECLSLSLMGNCFVSKG